MNTPLSFKDLTRVKSWFRDKFFPKIFLFQKCKLYPIFLKIDGCLHNSCLGAVCLCTFNLS